ncbi:sensor domain-containing diguanylate cyclase [Planococcus kocurii]|uniref:sensor domain-containing diguanylate cyclase n=1 Tax=Planococcus kocurii TaxID=1374 RepID=UPI003D089AF0
MYAEEAPPTIKLGSYYDIFLDPTNEVTVEELLSGEYTDSFTPSTQEYLNFWHTDDTVWLRLDADEVITDKDESYWLELIDKLETIELYLVKQDGSYDKKIGGFSNLEERQIKFRSILFSINDPSIDEIYLKIEGSMPLTVISSLSTTTGFIEKTIVYKFFVGAFYGFLTALSIYNLFLFLSFKEKTYLYYVFYMWSFMVFQATMNTFDIELTGHFLPEWFFTRSLVLSCNLLLLFMTLFGRNFLELKKYLPIHNNLLTIALWINAVLFITVLLTPDVMAVNNITTIFTMLVLVLLWVSGLTLLLKGYKAARFYMVGWTILLSSIIIQGLGFLGVIPLHPRIYEDIPAIGAIFEAIFLSLALGDKINIIKKEHQEMQLQLNANLEHKVKERTQQLELAKQELEQLANTDRLTKIPNRLRLDRVLETELRRAQHDEVPLSIILLDIDHFKSVNDQFGHQVGDIVLIEVANLLKDHIQAGNTVGRWGGEEFLIICPDTQIDDAIKLSSKLREQFERYHFQAVERKTCSFGVTAYMEGDTLNTMVSRADHALYQAKDKGRNRVEYALT